MRIADELYLKRLIVGGIEGVFEISKDFRNEGMDKDHNPEFTMMELYVAYQDYAYMMELVEAMAGSMAVEALGKEEVFTREPRFPSNLPGKGFSYHEAIRIHAVSNFSAGT